VTRASLGFVLVVVLVLVVDEMCEQAPTNPSDPFQIENEDEDKNDYDSRRASNPNAARNSSRGARANTFFLVNGLVNPSFTARKPMGK